MGGMTRSIDNYCERVDPSFWAEPLNAATNIAFILAALIAYRLAARSERLEPLTWALIGLAVAIGIGSFLFHTVAQAWAGVADTLPILIFILVYIYAATRRYFDAPVWASFLAIPGFFAFTAAFLYAWTELIPGVQASQGYLPVLVFIILYGVLLARRGHPAATGMIAAAAVFSLSLTFRSIDGPICELAPFGTHFMWHILNGVLLGVVMVTFIRHGAPRLAAAAAAR